jgi:hypothetical protein
MFQKKSLATQLAMGSTATELETEVTQEGKYVPPSFAENEELYPSYMA